MKSTVAIYDSHWTSLDAIERLKDNSYPINQLSIMGQAKIVDDPVNNKSKKPLKKVHSGLILGSTLGVLPGVGIFSVPGFGYVFGAGAIKKELAGYVIGFIGDGIVSIFKKIGINNAKVDKYSKYLKEGNFLVIAQGNDEEVKKAKDILSKSGKNIEVSIN
jgi:hypothetical protein